MFIPQMYKINIKKVKINIELLSPFLGLILLNERILSDIRI